jgi:hypothetical protein
MVSERLAVEGAVTSTGSKGESYDNALAGSDLRAADGRHLGQVYFPRSLMPRSSSRLRLLRSVTATLLVEVLQPLEPGQYLSIRTVQVAQHVAALGDAKEDLIRGRSRGSNAHGAECV